MSTPSECIREITPTDVASGRGLVSNGIPRKIWIDLDNSPHVPLFAPIVEELEKRGLTVLITARDCFQVCELVELHGLSAKVVGRHYGKSMIRKLFGLALRSMQLIPSVVMGGRPDLALSHGSRSQLLLAKLFGIRSVVMMDYEFARGLASVRPTYMMLPEIVAAGGVDRNVLQYPGIKEDVYTPRFKPDPAIKAELGLEPHHIVVTLRPPANEAHYHNDESELLLDTVFDLLKNDARTKVILLPRNERQGKSIQSARPELFEQGKVMIPGRALDGLNLIWHSDLVISGGGTMNREAAALGVPVYSIFRGKIGAVDRYLAENGRLVLLESPDDVRKKIVLTQRARQSVLLQHENPSLQRIVDNVIVAIGDKK